MAGNSRAAFGLQMKRGNAAANNTYVGGEGEMTLDLENRTVRIHDGVTAGGIRAVRFDELGGNLGVGPTTLIAGDMTAGFFGTVLNTELVTAAKLLTDFNLTHVDYEMGETDWLKFASNDKIMYVAKYPIRRYIRYDWLVSRGVVDGSTVITLGENNYRIRLITGANTSPVSDTVSEIATDQSEWDRLMLALLADDPLGRNWAGYSAADIMRSRIQNADSTTTINGTQTWCYNENTDGTKAVQRGEEGSGQINDPYATNLVTKTASYTMYAWRPVLELVA